MTIKINNMNTKNFFENAVFGDKFVDGSGAVYIYHYSEPYKGSDGETWIYHYLMREPVVIKEFDNMLYHPYGPYVFIDGYGVSSDLKYYSIQSIKDSHNKDYLIVGKL